MMVAIVKGFTFQIKGGEINVNVHAFSKDVAG